MNYPVWEVPYIGLPWVVGIIAIFHIMISHFAVGGGIYLALAERKIQKEGLTAWKPVLIGHSKFFLVLTGVFGAISGVGIWFAIGLIQPEATSTLIHSFVFGWAIEWVFFMIELTAAGVYYYTWGRIPDKLHLQVGYVYAIASVLTLVIINGILTFMLTPGATWLNAAGTGHVSWAFWYAFFNATYFPSLVLRLLVCAALAGVWALLTFSRLDNEKSGAVKVQMVRWSITWLLPAFVLMPFAFLWYLLMVPADSRHLMDIGVHTIGAGAFTQVTRVILMSVMATATVAAIAYFFAYRYPKDFTPGHAGAILFVALVATGSTEYAREALRKPYVIDGHMYSNGIRVSQVQEYDRDGVFGHTMWKPAANASATERGEMVFRTECMACHTVNGYRSMKGFMKDRDPKAIVNIVNMLRDRKPDSPYRYYMPPLVGTDEDVADLEAYLDTMGMPPSVEPLPAAPAAPAGANAQTATAGAKPPSTQPSPGK